MCGRFNIKTPGAEIAQSLGAQTAIEFSPNYNIPPTTPIPALTAGRVLRLHRWGLVPAWAKDPSIGARMFNARSETAASKPSFRAAYRRRRCVVPASGYYEWKRENGRKTPYFIYNSEAPLLLFAGLWERWETPEGEELLSATVLTREATEEMASVHHRMPVLLAPDEIDPWLAPELQNTDEIARYCEAEPPVTLAMHEVSSRVGSVRNNDATLADPVDSSRRSAAPVEQTNESDEPPLLRMVRAGDDE